MTNRVQVIAAALGLALGGCGSETSTAKDGSSSAAGPYGAPPAGSQADAQPQPQPPRPRVCTELPCVDEARIVAELSATSAPPGSHSFEITIDGKTKRCSVVVVAGARADATCSDGGLSLAIGPKMEQKTRDLGAVVEGYAVAVPGRMTWELQLHGRPKSVRVVHTSGAAKVVDRTEQLAYAERRPNGVGCEPACMSASVTWTIS